MLLSFRFANHRSFRDEQQLNLLPAYESDYPDDIPALPVVGIFGANASGKSNTIGALVDMQRLAIYSDRESDPDTGVERSPYRLDPGVAVEPSRYVVDLMIEGIRYTYGFALDDNEILEEWLYSYPLKRRRVIFERNGSAFHFGEEAQRTPLDRVVEITAPNALFLTIAARARQEPVIPVFNWFYRNVRVSLQQSRFLSQRNLSRYIERLEDKRRKEIVIDLVRAAGLGLQDVLLSTPSDSEQEQPDLDFLSGREALGPGYRMVRGNGRRLLFSHTGAQGEVFLEWADQSTGTRQLFDLALKAESALHGGSLLLVDEIDSSLHPVLTASLIRLFQNFEVNKKGAQLILTTHDSTLLGSLEGSDILCRDQIWFTEKGDDGASILFPLSDFHPRKQENRQRRYLNGSYGAIPIVSDELFIKALTSRGDMDDPEESS